MAFFEVAFVFACGNFCVALCFAVAFFLVACFVACLFVLVCDCVFLSSGFFGAHGGPTAETGGDIRSATGLRQK